MTTEQILTDEFTKIIKDLKAKHIELGMKASGKWLEGVVLETTETSATIFGTDYTKYLVDGRPPSDKFPPIDKIKQWIYDKGLNYDIPINSLAYLIARKISEKGTNYFQEGGTDLVDAVITPQRIQDIIDRVGTQMVIRLLNKLQRTFETAA